MRERGPVDRLLRIGERWARAREIEARAFGWRVDHAIGEEGGASAIGFLTEHLDPDDVPDEARRRRRR